MKIMIRVMYLQNVVCCTTDECRTVYILGQLLRGVTISNGGVLPRIHPELLSKKRGGRVKVDSQSPVSEKPEECSKSKKSIKPFKKVKGKRGRKPKVSLEGGGE